MASNLTMEVLPIIKVFSENATYDEVQLAEPWMVDSWFLMSRPDLVLIIAFLYLAFVLRVGPALMSKRPPLTLQTTLVLYNGALVAFSSWWMYKVAFEVGLMSRLSCMAHTPSDRENYLLNTMVWYFLMSKFVELLDTVFFVLRKKQNQVSFLHVYHHTNMFVFTWATLKFVRGDQIMLIGFVNSGVHAVMYGYYMIAAMGPKYSKFLWFKPYITWLQMGQFIFLIGYMVYLLCLNCDAPKQFVRFGVFNTSTFLVLFVNFYYQTYIKPKAVKVQ